MDPRAARVAAARGAADAVGREEEVALARVQHERVQVRAARVVGPARHARRAAPQVDGLGRWRRQHRQRAALPVAVGRAPVGARHLEREQHRQARHVLEEHEPPLAPRAPVARLLEDVALAEDALRKFGELLRERERVLHIASRRALGEAAGSLSFRACSPRFFTERGDLARGRVPQGLTPFFQQSGLRGPTLLVSHPQLSGDARQKPSPKKATTRSSTRRSRRRPRRRRNKTRRLPPPPRRRRRTCGRSR